MRVQLSDPALVEEFLQFLWSSGFIAEQDGADTVAASLPIALERDGRVEDINLFLAIWLDIALRVWKELRPGSEALVVIEPEPAERRARAS